MRTQNLQRNNIKWLQMALTCLAFLAKRSVYPSIAISKYHRLQKLFVQEVNTLEMIIFHSKAKDTRIKEMEASLKEAEAENIALKKKLACFKTHQSDNELNSPKAKAFKLFTFD
jgi:hypothetical protein